MWSIVAVEATQSWAERTGRSLNDSFNGLLRRPHGVDGGDFRSA
jgi:hypothetical protein